jgi:hypothetical protein
MKRDTENIALLRATNDTSAGAVVRCHKCTRTLAFSKRVVHM